MAVYEAFLAGTKKAMERHGMISGLVGSSPTIFAPVFSASLKNQTAV